MITYPEIATRARVTAASCFALLGLAIPLSTALDGVLQGVVLLAWLIALPRDCREWRTTLTENRAIAVAAALFVLIACSTLYSEVGIKAGWNIAGKYADLFLISLLVWAARGSPIARFALPLFVLAIVLNLVVSYLVANSIFQTIPGLHTFPHYPVGFKLSVTHGIFVSFGAFVALLLAREAKTFAVRAPLVGLAVLCAHNVLVMVIGRTGYVVLGLLLAYFVTTYARTWKSYAVASVAAVALAAAAYSVSANLQERVQEVVRDLEQWKPGAADKTSVGQRLEYTLTGLRIIAEHPLTGVGAGAFERAYAKETTSSLVTRNPHNDYVMIGAQVGVPGMLLLLALYVLLWRDAAHLGSRLNRDLLRGVVLTLAVGGLFNSLLLDHAEGLFFAWIVALGYSRRSA